MYDYLVTIAKDMTALTRELSLANKPDTSEAFEIITGLLERVAKGKYDTQCKAQLLETKARIEDELSERKFDPAALRIQMRTQNAKWRELQDKFTALVRSKTSTENLLIEPESYLNFKPVPKSIPSNKPYITFRHQVIFTNKRIISAESLRRLPEAYKAIAMGSGYRFDNQLILALTSQASKNIKTFIADLNKELNRKYIPCFSELSGDKTYFRVPGSPLIYVWLIPQNIAHHIKLDLRSVILPDRDIDNHEKPKTPDLNNLRLLRAKLEDAISRDAEIKKLRNEKERLDLLSRDTKIVEGKIQERIKIIREEIRKAGV